MTQRQVPCPRQHPRRPGWRPPWAMNQIELSLWAQPNSRWPTYSYRAPLKNNGTRLWMKPHLLQPHLLCEFSRTPPPRRVIVKTPECIVIKKELHANVDGATAVRAEGGDGTTILVTSSPKQVLLGTNAEGDLTSDTTLSESIETGARPTIPADHSYSFTSS